jgi:thiol-disulfide isomerase/thioredoxin
MAPTGPLMIVIMREIFKNLAVFVALCFTFSSLTGCGGGVSSGGNNTVTLVNTASSPGSGSDKSSAYPALSTGMMGVEIEALDGTKTKIADHKGKVMMLNLWGIWCGPCREEMPHLGQMQKQYADKGLEVISLNIGDHDGRPEPVENIKKFAEQMKLDYQLARIQGDSISQFYLLSKQQVVPQTVLIDRDLHLRGVFVGGGQAIFNQMQQTLDKTMNE